jgi:hypothetical protein
VLQSCPPPFALSYALPTRPSHSLCQHHRAILLPFLSIKTASIDSIVSDVAYQDGFKLVGSKKGKPGAGPSPRVLATAAANTDRQGQLWQSPFEWLTKYGLKGIKNRWTRAMAGTGICPICHRDEQLYHVPTKCPLLTELNLKLIVCQPARPSPAAAAPVGAKADPAGTLSPAPNPSGHAASANTGSGSGSAGLVAAPSGLMAAVAPVSDKKEEYDTGEEFTWDGNETAFRDLDCNLTKSVGLYPLPSCCHAWVSFSTNDAPSAASPFLPPSPVSLTNCPFHPLPPFSTVASRWWTLGPRTTCSRTNLPSSPTRLSLGFRYAWATIRTSWFLVVAQQLLPSTENASLFGTASTYLALLRRSTVYVHICVSLAVVSWHQIRRGS